MRVTHPSGEGAAGLVEDVLRAQPDAAALELLVHAGQQRKGGEDYGVHVSIRSFEVRSQVCGQSLGAGQRGGVELPVAAHQGAAAVTIKGDHND